MRGYQLVVMATSVAVTPMPVVASFTRVVSARCSILLQDALHKRRQYAGHSWTALQSGFQGLACGLRRNPARRFHGRRMHFLWRL